MPMRDKHEVGESESEWACMNIRVETAGAGGRGRMHTRGQVSASMSVWMR